MNADSMESKGSSLSEFTPDATWSVGRTDILPFLKLAKGCMVYNSLALIS